MILSDLNMLSVLVLTHGVLFYLAHAMPSLKVVDMSYNYRENETLAYPVYPPFKLNVLQKGYSKEGVYYAYNSYFTPEHMGTHIDVPSHLILEGRTVDKMPITSFFGPGAVIDISEKAKKDRNALADVNDIVHWEEENGRIPNHAILLIRSGFGKYWPDAKTYQGRETEQDYQLSFPGMDPYAAAWLVKNRKIVGVGIDTPSIDNGISKTFGSHVELSKASIYIIENVANLDKLPSPTGFTIFALPMKLYEGTGAPTRVVALLGDPSSSCRPTTNALYLALVVAILRIIELIQ